MGHHDSLAGTKVFFLFPEDTDDIFALLAFALADSYTWNAFS